MKFTAPHNTPLGDPDIEAFRRNVDQRFREVIDLPASSLRVIPNVRFAPGVDTAIAHGLGRAPIAAWLTPVRAPVALATGFFIQYLDTFPTSGVTIDRSKIVVFAAFNFGATVTCDVVVL